MADVKSYSPDDVHLSFNGVPISGFATGSFITVERSNPSASKVVGSQGDVTVVKSLDKSGMITVVLQQSSPSNDVLSAFMSLWEASTGLYASALVKHLNGTSQASASKTWVTQPSNMEFSNDLTDRTWVIECADLSLFVGGSLV